MQRLVPYEVRLVELKRLPAAFYQRPTGREHGFVKNAQKTPKPDLELARQRAKEITS